MSHDQFFISKVCKELWTIRNQSIMRFNGEFEEYKKLVGKSESFPLFVVMHRSRISNKPISIQYLPMCFRNTQKLNGFLARK